MLEEACHKAQLCLQPSSTLWVWVSSTFLRSQHPHGRRGEGPLFAHVRRPDPVFLPERRLKIFKAALMKTTDFLHFSNLLSRCGEAGSGISKGLSAAAPPGAGASVAEPHWSCWTWPLEGCLWVVMAPWVSWVHKNWA